jgi:exonuclease III
MFYSGVDEKTRASKGVAIYVDKKWESRIRDYSFLNERIITMKMNHDRGYIIVIVAYAPEGGKKEETISFYKMIQKFFDNTIKSIVFY